MNREKGGFKTAIVVITFQNFAIFQHRSVKRNLISCRANLVYDLREIPNDLRLRIFENQEILEKSQIWVDLQPSARSTHEKPDFGNSSQKTRKIRYHKPPPQSSLTGSPHPAPNTPLGTARANKCLVLTLLIDIFYYLEAFLRSSIKIQRDDSVALKFQILWF